MLKRFVLLCLVSSRLFAASHHPQAFLETVKGTPDEGARIAEHFCQSCHAEKPVIPLGAPRKGIADDWAPRLKLGFDSLFKHANEGLRAMPPRGGCFECTDEQLVLAIKALLPVETSNSD